jgi:hypothetical protein
MLQKIMDYDTLRMLKEADAPLSRHPQAPEPPFFIYHSSFIIFHFSFFIPHCRRLVMRWCSGRRVGDKE